MIKKQTYLCRNVIATIACDQQKLRIHTVTNVFTQKNNIFPNKALKNDRFHKVVQTFVPIIQAC